jgi:hypothetical protein
MITLFRIYESLLTLSIMSLLKSNHPLWDFMEQGVHARTLTHKIHVKVIMQKGKAYATPHTHTHTHNQSYWMTPWTQAILPSLWATNGLYFCGSCSNNCQTSLKWLTICTLQPAPGLVHIGFHGYGIRFWDWLAQYYIKYNVWRWLSSGSSPW